MELATATLVDLSDMVVQIIRRKELLTTNAADRQFRVGAPSTRMGGNLLGMTKQSELQSVTIGYLQAEKPESHTTEKGSKLMNEIGCLTVQDEIPKSWREKKSKNCALASFQKEVFPFSGI